MFKSRTLWTAVTMAALGMLLYVGKAGAECAYPLSASSADSGDTFYAIHGADSGYRWTIQDVNNNTTFGVTAGTLSGNPMTASTSDSTVPPNGFADTIGSASGFSVTPPLITFPTGALGGGDIFCNHWCADNDGNGIMSRDDRVTAGGTSSSTANDGCVTEFLMRDGQGNIARTAFKEGAGTFAAPHPTSGSSTAGLAVFDGKGDANSDGFPGSSGTADPYVIIAK